MLLSPILQCATNLMPDLDAMSSYHSHIVTLAGIHLRQKHHADPTVITMLLLWSEDWLKEASVAGIFAVMLESSQQIPGSCAIVGTSFNGPFQEILISGGTTKNRAPPLLCSRNRLNFFPLISYNRSTSAL